MEFVLDNVVGTANILDYARDLNEEKKLERLVYFSTDEILDQHQKELIIKKMIDIIQQIHIAQQKQVVKN